MRMRMRAAVVVLAVAMLTSCFGGEPDASAYVVTQVSGTVQYHQDEQQSFTSLKQGTQLMPGAVVRVLSQSAVTLTRGVDSFLRLRPFDPTERCDDLRGTERIDCLDSAQGESAPPAQLRIATIEQFDVSSGDVLIRSTADAPIHVTSNGVAARTEEGTFRFDRRLSLRVAAYEGTTNIEASGSVLALPSLREGIVAGRELPREPSLLRFRPADPWDRELLKDVIDLDNEIDAQKRGYEGNFGRRTRDAGEEMDALASMAPDQDVDFLRASLRDRRKGDVLVGLVFALLLQDAGKGPADQNYQRLLDLLDQGATWGFLARDNAISAEQLIGGVVRAIGLRTGEVDPGTTIVGPTPAPSVRPTGSASPGPTNSSLPSPTSSPTRKPTTSPSPTRSPTTSPSPSPSPSPTCVNVGPVCVG